MDEITNPTVRRHLAKNNKCPECMGELDEGYECTVCGFDAADDLQKPVASRDITLRKKDQ